MFRLFRKNTDSATTLFARRLAADVAKRYPAHLDAQPDKRPSLNRLTRIVEEACNKALAFQQQERLGWFGRARLGSEFKWALSELGYSKEFSELATEAVIVLLSKPPSNAKNTHRSD